MPLKQLIIVRHAKSDWSNDVIDDFNRPLSQRGDQDAPLVANWMAKHVSTPDIFISSPAKRARQTSLAIANAYGLTESSISFDDQVYLAGLQSLLTVLTNIPDECQIALLVGHNPGLENLLLHLSADIPPYTKDGKLLTTANVVQLEFIQPQQNVIEPKCCKLLRIVRPSDLK